MNVARRPCATATCLTTYLKTIEAWNVEYGPGQVEVNLGHGSPIDVPRLDRDSGGLEDPLDLADQRLDLVPLLHRVAVGAEVQRLPVRPAEVELELGRGDRLVAEAADTLHRPAQDRTPVHRNRFVRCGVDRVADAEGRALPPRRDAK